MGVVVLRKTKASVRSLAGKWRARLPGAASENEWGASVLVDATGKAAAVSRKAGARHYVLDRMVAVAAFLPLPVGLEDEANYSGGSLRRRLVVFGAASRPDGNGGVDDGRRSGQEARLDRFRSLVGALALAAAACGPARRGGRSRGTAANLSSILSLPQPRCRRELGGGWRRRVVLRSALRKRDRSRVG